MPTVHQEQALAIVEALSGLTEKTGAGVRSAFDQVIPGWQVSCTNETGYANDPLCDTIIALARALHVSLPTPFNLLPFNWRDQHGLGIVVIFLSQPNLTAAAIDPVLNGAADQLALVLADA